jgi:D-3-phosphoglycerate dehydrogenase
MNVLITDAVAQACVDLLEAAGIRADVQLKKSPAELKALAAGADGWIIRSGTTITADLIEAADRLKVIGRAGVGVDNIDLDAATRRGVLVINAPDGNTISTAEHTCAMLLALARHIPQANASLASGKWERKAFTGSELEEKTLGILGLGKIGRAVATRMLSFGMRVIGYDPVLSRDAAERMGVTLASVDEVLAQSDFITVHTPLNDMTRGLLNAKTLPRCKRGVRIVNCARGGIVDEMALLDALESGQVGGAALDVYSEEPPPAALEKLLQHPNLVATPHIAASTEEAQEKVARQITEQVVLALQGKPVLSPVNGMAIRMAAQPEVQPFLELAGKLGRLAGQLAEGNLESLMVRCYGDVPHRYAEVLSVAALSGLLGALLTEPVNLINAPVLAESMGLRVEEQRAASHDSFVNLIEVVAGGGRRSRLVGGTVFGRNDPRLARVDDYDVEVRLEGRLLFYANEDRPGMVAAVGGILADANINIGVLQLGRKGGRGSMALTALSVDDDIPQGVLDRIAGLRGVQGVRLVRV